MKRKYKILYCSYSQIPSATANSIAVLKQCSKLDKISNLKIILIKGDSKECYSDIYNIQKLDIILLPKWAAKHNSLGLRIFSAFYAKIHSFDAVYTRDVFISRALNRFRISNYYEMHQLDQKSENFDKKYKKCLIAVSKSRFTKKIICISNTLKKECINFGIQNSKIQILHSGFDYSNSESKIIGANLISKISFPNTKPLAVYTGSIAKGKGVEIIQKMSQLSKNFNFLIVGGKKGEISESDNLKHLPWIQPKYIPSILNLADFLIIPTTVQKYKFHSPLKLFEYLASGKIVVASNIECIREIITHCKNGVLADPQNPASFLEQMRFVSNNPRLAEQIRMNAISSVKEYSWKKRAQNIIEIIERGENIYDKK